MTLKDEQVSIQETIAEPKPTQCQVVKLLFMIGISN
jgi:hypothetical protein